MIMTVTLGEALAVLAAFLSAIIAIKYQKWKEKRDASKDRKEFIFKQLMKTRGLRHLSEEHIEAIHMIPLEFRGKKFKKVISSWEVYLNLLNKNPMDINMDQSTDFLVTLLVDMAESLGYNDFERQSIRTQFVVPYQILHEKMHKAEIDIELLALLKNNKDAPEEVLLLLRSLVIALQSANKIKNKEDKNS